MQKISAYLQTREKTSLWKCSQIKKKAKMRVLFQHTEEIHREIYKLLKIEVYDDNRQCFHYSDNSKATVIHTILFLYMFTVDIRRHRKGSCAAFPLKAVTFIKLVSIFRK